MASRRYIFVSCIREHAIGHTRAGKVGVATGIGIRVGPIAKLVPAFMVVGLFAAALLF